MRGTGALELSRLIFENRLKCGEKRQSAALGRIGRASYIHRAIGSRIEQQTADVVGDAVMPGVLTRGARSTKWRKLARHRSSRPGGQ